MNPFFSIILPTFNQANFLKKSIESVFNQSYKNWELIIIDNYSSDETEKVINFFKDSRVRSYKIRNKNILAKSRNLGIKKSKSDWICFIDSDDTWYPKKLEVTKNFIDQNRGDLFYHDLEFTNKNLLFKKKKIEDKSQTISNPILGYFAKNGNGIGQSSVTVRKKILKRIGLISEKKDKFSWEDFDTWIRISKITQKFTRIPVVLGSIWVGPENISNLDKQIKNSINIKKYYGKQFSNFLKKKDKNLWWLEYPRILKDFRDYNNQECIERIDSITKPPDRIKYIINYFKLIIFLRKFKNFIRKIFNIVIIFKNKKNHKNSIYKSKVEYKIIKNSKQLSKEKIENFKVPSYFYQRLNDKKKLHLLKNKKKLLTYGWSSQGNNFFITEVNCNIIVKKKIIFYDFKTFHSFRRRGYYKLILNLMLQYYKNYDCFIYSNLINFKSFFGIKKADFKIFKILSIFSNNIEII